VAQVFQRDNVLQNVEQRGEQLRSLARGLANKYPKLIKEVRGWGLINGIELQDDCGFGAAEVTKALLESGVLVVPAGPKVIRFVPPLIITEREVAQAMSQVEDALKVLSK
jgi:acetylornithine aminotransferase